MKPKNCAVHRDMLNDCSKLVCHLMDDESQPDEVRDKAALMQYWLSEVLCYQNHSAEGERSLRLVPVGFKWPQFYTQMVDELVLDLYGSVEPTDIRSIRIMLARQAAAIVDDMLYSTDFRLEAYEALNEIVDGMKESAEEDDDENDEIPDKTTEYVKGYNAAPK
jgi:hypothetical protein